MWNYVVESSRRQCVSRSRATTASRVALLLRLMFAVVVLAFCAQYDNAFAQDQPPYAVSGFRDARFGMSEQDVRAVVVKDFGLKPADITSAVNPVEGTMMVSRRPPTSSVMRKNLPRGFSLSVRTNGLRSI